MGKRIPGVRLRASASGEIRVGRGGRDSRWPPGLAGVGYVVRPRQRRRRARTSSVLARLFEPSRASASGLFAPSPPSCDPGRGVSVTDFVRPVRGGGGGKTAWDGTAWIGLALVLCPGLSATTSNGGCVGGGRAARTYSRRRRSVTDEVRDTGFALRPVRPVAREALGGTGRGVGRSEGHQARDLSHRAGRWDDSEPRRRKRGWEP